MSLAKFVDMNYESGYIEVSINHASPRCPRSIGSSLSRHNETMSLYATTPLDPLGNQIRLLSVLPGKFREQIRCFLVTVALRSFEIMGNTALAPRSERLSVKEACFATTLRYSMELLTWSRYEALSYTWGQTAPNIPVTVNN